MTIKSLSIIASTLLFTTNIHADETLEDIIITSATKSEQKIKDVTSNVNVITAQEIEERGFTTVTEALNSLPGVSFTSNGGLGQNTSVILRGMDSQRTLVLIDGIRYNDITSLSGAPFAHLMINDIKQIEVVKGAQSGIWGADASAGVINIITKKPESGIHGSVHAEKGSFNTNKYGATLSSKTENYYFKASHNVIETDGFTAQAPEGEDIDQFEDDAYKNKTTSLQFGFNINETNKIDLSHTIIDATNQYDPYGDPDGFSSSTTDDTFSSINFHHIDRFNELDIYAKRSIFDREYVSPYGTSPFDGEVREYGFKSKVPYLTEDFVVWGADYKSFEHKNDIDEKFNNKGIFLTNSNVFKGFMGGKTILTESLRYDNYSTFDNKLTGKIGLKHIHEKIEGLTTSLNYGTAYNVPTLYQLYSPYGSPLLDPEATRSFDITVEYKAFKVTYFDTKIDDMIDFDMSTYTYGNLAGTSKINGLETSYQKEVFENVLLSINYTHLFQAEDQDGKDLKRRAKENLKIAVDYYGIEKLHLGVAAEYVGSRTDIKYNPNYTTSDIETGKYTVIDFTANYDISKEIQLYGKIENLTDKYYQTVYGYATSPRAFSLGLKASF